MLTGPILIAFGIAITACGVTATYQTWRDNTDAAYDASADETTQRMAGHAELMPDAVEPEPTLADEYEHRIDEHGNRRVVQVAPIITAEDEQQFDTWPTQPIEKTASNTDTTGWGNF